MYTSYNSYYGAGDLGRTAATGTSAYSFYFSKGAGGRMARVGAYGSSDLPSLYPERPSTHYYGGYLAGDGEASLHGSSAYEPGVAAAGSKRSAEAAYHPAVLGSHNSIWRTDSLYSSNPLIKRSRVEIGSNLPIYPQRPGEKHCTYYMLTRTCKFGDACKFDHPIWAPEGGLPDWNKVRRIACFWTTTQTSVSQYILSFQIYANCSFGTQSLVPTSEVLPERPGELDCPYYLKTQKCKFGPRCKFNHPKENSSNGVAEGSYAMDKSILPERPTEPICTIWKMKHQNNFRKTSV